MKSSAPTGRRNRRSARRDRRAATTYGDCRLHPPARVVTESLNGGPFKQALSDPTFREQYIDAVAACIHDQSCAGLHTVTDGDARFDNDIRRRRPRGDRCSSVGQESGVGVIIHLRTPVESADEVAALIHLALEHIPLEGFGDPHRLRLRPRGPLAPDRLLQDGGAGGGYPPRFVASLASPKLTCVRPIRDLDANTPFLASLADDPRFADVTEQLLGREVLAIGVDGIYYAGDTR